MQEGSPTEELTSESDSDDYIFDQTSEISTPRKTRNPSTEIQVRVFKKEKRRPKISGRRQLTISVVVLPRARSQREAGGPSDSQILTEVPGLGSCVGWELPSSAD